MIIVIYLCDAKIVCRNDGGGELLLLLVLLLLLLVVVSEIEVEPRR
jgi:hypothetical protein